MKLALPLLLSAVFLIKGTAVNAQNVAGPLAGTATNNSSVGTYAWASLSSIASSDGVYAVSGHLVGLIFPVVSNYIYIQNFGFALNSTDIIDGVKVEVQRLATGLAVGGSVTDNSVMLLKGGSPVGTDQASPTAWPVLFEAFTTYGGSTAMWGATLLPADINASNFGVAISTNLNPGVVSLVEAGNIDQVLITVYSHPGIILPLHLEGFSAMLSGPSNLLSWSAADISKLDKFMIERSANASDWQEIASIPAAPDQTAYTYSDLSPLDGFNYYRIKMVSNQAQPSYSTISKIDRNDAIRIRVFPNPVVNSVSISSSTPIHKVTLQDTGGRIISSTDAGKSSGGIYSMNVPMTRLKNGLYILQVDGKNFKLLKK